MQTVSDFMTKQVVHLSPANKVSDAIYLMREKKIGAVIVKDNDTLLGIFTERDFLTKIDISNPGLLTQTELKDVMTKDLQTVDRNEPFIKVMDLMRTHKIRHTPVLTKNQVVGMVSLRELLTHYEQHLQHLLEDKEAQLFKTLEKMKESEERFRTVFNNSAVAITLTDKHERIVAWNPFAANLLEMTEKDLLNKPVKELYSQKEWTNIRSLNIRKLGMKHHLETQVLNKRGELLDVDVSISVLKDAQGNVTGSIGIMRDIRERKKSENELEKYRKHLEDFVDKRTEELRMTNEHLRQENNERKRVEEALQKAYVQLKNAQNQLVQIGKMQVAGGLATGVAHEVKNPLMIIHQGVSYLTKKIRTEDPDVKLALEHITSAVRSADRIVRGLIDFATVSELRFEKVSVEKVIDEVLEFTKHHMFKNHVEVKKEIQEHLPDIDLDKNKMNQVYINLILNAISSMPDRGVLTIRIYLKRLTEFIDGVAGYRKDDPFIIGDRVLVVEIIDTGTGIPDDIMDKIFDPFFTTKRTMGGTGLGLPMVKNIINMHNGIIKVEHCHETKGTKVSTFLKLTQPTLYGS